MKILITGATGMVGKKLIQHLVNLKLKDNEIAVVIRDIEKFQLLFGEYGHIECINLSKIDYKEDIKRFNPEVVIHLASYLTSKDDEESIEQILDSNIKFGTNILNALQDTQIKYFINVGTFAEYLYNDGELISAYLYAASKTAFRSILKYYSGKIGFRWINVIPYTIYGGDDAQKKVLDYIISSLNTDKKIPMSGGEQKLDFIHIDDVVDFFVTLIEKIDLIKQDYVEFHLGTGKSTSLKELGEIVEWTFDKPININWGKLPYRERDVMQAIAHTSKNKEILNWEAQIDIKSGVRRMNKEINKNE